MPCHVHSGFICAPNLIALDSQNATIKFSKNLNSTQRDEYETDRTNSATGRQTGYLVKIQGDKAELVGNDRKRSVRPKIKVSSNYQQDSRI